MKLLILICILVGLLVHSSTGTRCVCKCCTSDGCDSSTAIPQSFDLSGVCNAVTCNRLSCSIQFKTCPIPTSAGHVDSTCGGSSMTSLTTQISVMTLSAVLIGTFMKWNVY
ncbi:unnamed protein product [Rotaria sp. Silwood1]|nr:unnamed protein product [Rotaria sp. Silwood1]CAF3765863.1 unnamed protein product [Rotaria sp. Silwood1]CAF3840708.1 unnamed protein product [Rotaria sp. Silwood1]CAF4559024.1 unnamed protein product [Rotaria sp. Silwood1]CAF4688545.1 unnamed protein product [Rotaria sp. Silwood1]